MEQLSCLVPEGAPSVFVGEQILVDRIERINAVGIGSLDDMVVSGLLDVIQRRKPPDNDGSEEMPWIRGHTISWHGKKPWLPP